MHISDIRYGHPGTLSEKLETLFNLNRGNALRLEFNPVFLNLLAKLGDPHLRLPPVLHVAGTNGKGSIIATSRSILEAAGYKVHVYTSPHLCRFNERIVLAGQEIDDGMLERFIDRIMHLNQGETISFFEATTALAFAAFAETPADVLLLEVGLGGRLDCTNIIPEAAVSIIASLSYDHMNQLGNTLPLIAGEKAGIMKPGTPCVIGPLNGQALAENVMHVFQDRAAKVSAPLHRYGSEWCIEAHVNHMRFSSNSIPDLLLPLPSLQGEHQIANAGAAIAGVSLLAEKIKLNVSEQNFRDGIAKAKWPARLQKMDAGRFAESLNISIAPAWEIWLDGGHNQDAGEALGRWAQNQDGPFYLIWGMMDHKDPARFITPLMNHCAQIVTVGIPGEPAAVIPEDLASVIKIVDTTYPAGARQTPEEALAYLTMLKPGKILIAGSLYLAGYILQRYGPGSHNGA